MSDLEGDILHSFMRGLRIMFDDECSESGRACGIGCRYHCVEVRCRLDAEEDADVRSARGEFSCRLYVVAVLTDLVLAGRMLCKCRSKNRGSRRERSHVMPGISDQTALNSNSCRVMLCLASASP